MTISNEFDSYWKLDTYDEINKDEILGRLQQYGFDLVNYSRRKSDLVSILHRYETGRVCFDKFTNSDLWNRASRVGLNLDGLLNQWREVSNAGRLRLIRCPEEQADKSLTFERFLDLPAELSEESRIRVLCGRASTDDQAARKATTLAHM
jgi:hypothetical protein